MLLEHQELKVPQVSPVLWAPPAPLERVGLDTLAPPAPLVLLAPLDTLMLVNLAARVPLVNPGPLACLETEGALEPLERWALEELLEPREHLDLLDFHL